MSANTESKMGNSARSAGTGIPDCAISASRPMVLSRHGLSAGVGTADDQLAMLTVEFDGERDHGNTPGFQGPLQQRMARVAQDERIT